MLEINDIQGLLIRAHGDMSAATYLMLGINKPQQAKNWLQAQLPFITHGGEKPSTYRMQLAFSFKGIKKLGADSFVEHGFSVEFVQGMTTPHKCRVLGDLDQSSPDNWQWGGTKTPIVDMVLMLFAADEARLASRLAALRVGFAEAGIEEIIQLPSQLNPFHKEHFGFRDGISQPIISGLKKQGTPENTVDAGEFILGYKNAYDQYPETPVLPVEMDAENLLSESVQFQGMKDFGKNGSYLVFRQLSQDVAGFWESVNASVKNENPAAGVAEAVQLAAKMVGRWPNGKPITLSPEQETPYHPAQDDDFLYAENDADGSGCPFGSHIRRSNPRDTMPDNKPFHAIRISNRHRILRRGRNFGPPLAASFAPEDLVKAMPDGQSRGLHFICFNTNLQRQFEFIQHSWSNNTKFAGLYSDPDPILGIKDSRDKRKTHDFTIQGKFLRRKVRGLARHVHVIGGAYFFMPGIRALQFLASQKDATR